MNQKSALSLFMAFFLSAQSVLAQGLTCAQVVEPKAAESEAAVKTRKMSKEEAERFSAELIDKKLLFSTLQFVSILSVPFKEPIQELSGTSNFSEYYAKKINKEDLGSLYREESAFSEIDRKNIEAWKHNSVARLEKMDAILDMSSFDREVILKKISKDFIALDSPKEIFDALVEIRRMRTSEPEKYQAFIEAWKATTPLAAQSALTRFEKASHKVEEGFAMLAVAALAIYGVPNAVNYFIGEPGFFTFAFMGLSGLFGFIGFPVMFQTDTSHLYGISSYTKARLKQIAFSVAKPFRKGSIKRMAKKFFAYNENEAENLVDNNTFRERSELNKLQDLSLPELKEYIEKVQKTQLTSEAELKEFQKAQMQIMNSLSSQFSIVSERQDKVSEKLVPLIEALTKNSKLTESERRKKVTEIGQLYSDAYEFNLDVGAVHETVKQVAYMLNEFSPFVKKVAEQNQNDETNQIYKQIIAQTSIVQGMLEAVAQMEVKTRNDVHNITELAYGSTANQVSERLKKLSQPR